MSKKILCLGNEFIKEDSLAKKISLEISKEKNGYEFININDSFQFIDYLQTGGEIIIIDVVKELKNVRIIDVIELKSKGMLTAHDFDAGFLIQLIGKDKEIKIIGIPIDGNEESIKSEVKRLLNN